jgi:hypothetical protein
MPFKSSTKTLKKKSLKNTQKKKSGTAKRSKNRSCKGGAKTKINLSPSPSPESSGEDIDNYKIPEDLPSPKEYTEELKKEDDKYVRRVMKSFYNKDKPHAAIKKLKGMKTDTREDRLKKKKSLAKAPSLIPVLPKAVEDTIFREINKRIQFELDNYAAEKEKRDKKFEKLINKLEDKKFNADHDYGYYVDKINEMDKLWKPENHYDFNDLGTAIDGEDPFLRFKEAKEHRIRYVEECIREIWNDGWRKSVKDYKPDSGRKLTDILIEDWLVPRCVDVYYGATYDEGYGDFSYSDEMYMIQDWNDAWIEANNDEYQKSDEYQEDIEKQMKKTNKDRANIIAELNNKNEEEQKFIRDAEEKEKREIAAAAEKRTRDAEADESKQNKKQKLRERVRRKKAMEEAALRPKPPAQKISATTMPPAAGDGPTPMISAERVTTMPPATIVNTPAIVNTPSTISGAEAENLARENEYITIVESSSNPGRYYMFNRSNGKSRWIV